MTFEEAFWKVFKLALWEQYVSSTTAENKSRKAKALFLDRMGINGRWKRWLAIKSANNSVCEFLFKKSFVYKTVLSSVQTDPLEYIPVLEEIARAKLKNMKSHEPTIKRFSSLSLRLDYIRAVEKLEETLKTIQRLIQ